MSKKVLIVENDATLSAGMRTQLAARDFEVDETKDGKGAADLIRRTRPDLVVLAVDLAAGQNGYLIFKKLRSDEELKNVPVIIIGNADGFAAHRKLKNHADDYLGKPFEPEAIVERVGNLIGLPGPKEQVVEDDSLSLNDLLTDQDRVPAGAEEIKVDDLPSETVASADPDFEMVDAVFDDPPTGETDLSELTAVDGVDVQAALAAHARANGSTDSNGSGSTDFHLEEASPDTDLAPALVVEPPVPPPPPAAALRSELRSETRADPELRELKSKVTMLTSSLEAAQTQQTELEEKVRDLESQLESQTTELEAARTAQSAKGDSKEVFALRDQLTKKDKEILKFKSELNDKEKEIVELHEKENALELQVSETSGELARRDAQLKTATTKSEQLALERKKIDQALMTAREEGRSAGARLTTLESELEDLQARNEALQMDLTTLKAEKDDLHSAHRDAEAKAKELDEALSEATQNLVNRTQEAEEVRSAHEQVQIDLESTKQQLSSQASAFADESSSLRRRVSELEEAGRKNDERVKALFARVKAEEALREKVKQSLNHASSLLDEESPASDLEISEEDLAEA